MDIPTIPGAVYTISTASSCDVTDKASGQLLGTASAGSPFTTPAYSDALTLSDPSALYVQIKTFNFALAALGLLGGGNSGLPAGYLRAAFLESTGTQKISVPMSINAPLGYELDAQFLKMSSVSHICSAGYDLMVLRYDPTKGIETRYGGKSMVMRATTEKINLSLNWKTSGLYIFRTESSATQQTVTSVLNSYSSIMLFAWPLSNSFNAVARVFKFSVSNGLDLATQLVPAVDKTGTPSMIDLVSKQPFRNADTGQFIVGFTLPQARQLGKLPSTGGTLTVSLPTGYESDAGVSNALETARANGWTLTVQTYESETASATFALSRIWVRRTADENGAYVDTAGTRWQVDWCVDMLTPDGSSPDQHGYELFRSVDAAVAYWELEPYVDPAWKEELLKNQEL